jgi:PAS domain S-box-containing protein
MVDRRFAILSEREALALRRSEERFRLLYQRTPLPLHSLDSEGRIEIVTDTWLELLGYERQEVIGRPLIKFMAEASARQVLVSDWPQLLQDGEMRHVEYRMVTKGGEFLDVMASVRVERAESGAPMRVLGGLADITERKRAEEALRQSQKIEAVGQLTGGVAHDFNNLLAVVMGNLELLRKRVVGDSKAAGLIDNALQGARRGAGLTQRLLAFARKQDLRPDVVDLPELVRGMAELLQRSIGPMILVDTHFPLSLPPAHVDANQLELALLNLAVNARDAMPEGGTLSISASEREITPSPTDGLRPGKYVLLSVTDTGMGMNATTLARATEPFFTTKGVGKGTGLGLSMAQGLAAQSGGRLAIQSEPGRGTSVTLWLPAGERKADTAQATVPIDPARAAEAVAALTILAVDDDPLVLSNTAAMLEDMGHTVLQAASGHEALSIVRAGSRVDLVVTDQAMPGMMGTQLASILRAEQPNIGILLVSGYADLPASASDNLPKLGKPFDQAALAHAISTIQTVGTRAVIISLEKRRGKPS